MNVSPYAKAVVAFFAAGFGAAATGALDGGLTLAEGLAAAGTAFGAAGLVFGVRNTAT